MDMDMDTYLDLDTPHGQKHQHGHGDGHGDYNCCSFLIFRRICRPLTGKIVRFFNPLICENAEKVNVLKAITSSI
jgi:hypothetical protein